MIRAYRLYTGEDGHSHVARGAIIDHNTTSAKSIHFEETPAHSALDWHTAPTTQYVIILSGVLEFSMHGDESFTINPGEILIAQDTTGSGHKWRLINNEPWKRAYVTFEQDTVLNFLPEDSLP